MPLFSFSSRWDFGFVLPCFSAAPGPGGIKRVDSPPRLRSETFPSAVERSTLRDRVLWRDWSCLSSRTGAGALSSPLATTWLRRLLKCWSFVTSTGCFYIVRCLLTEFHVPPAPSGPFSPFSFHLCVPPLCPSVLYAAHGCRSFPGWGTVPLSGFYDCVTVSSRQCFASQLRWRQSSSFTRPGFAQSDSLLLVRR